VPDIHVFQTHMLWSLAHTVTWVQSHHRLLLMNHVSGLVGHTDIQSLA